MGLTDGCSFTMHSTAASMMNPITTRMHVPYVAEALMVANIRDDLIDRVTELTHGNRHDYITRGDVSQIVDATLQALNEQRDEPDDEPDDAMGTEDDLGKV